MPALHSTLIHLRNALGYKKNEGGLCAFYTEKAVEAFLLGEYETVFKNRCDFIKENHNKFPEMLERARAQKKQVIPADRVIEAEFSDDELDMIFSVASFFDQGELYANTSDYNMIFGRPLRQYQVEDIVHYAQPLVLEKRGGRKLLASFYGMYSFKEFVLYLALLDELSWMTEHDFALTLGNSNHRIALCYSPAKKAWSLIDANQPFVSPLDSSSPQEEVIVEFQNFIFEAFSIEESSKIIGLKSNLYVRAEDFVLMDDCVARWFEHDWLKMIHKITEERIRYRAADRLTLALLATEMNDVNTLNKIMEIVPDFDFNQSINNDLTPLEKAISFGHLESLAFFIEARTSKGELLIDLNRADANGLVPIQKAIFFNNPEVIRMLAEAKAVNGEPAIDLNKVMSHFNTPLEAAIILEHADAVQALIEAKTAGGMPLVDLNQTNWFGRTPGRLALEVGNKDILKILRQAKTPEGEPAVNFSEFTEYAFLFKCMAGIMLTLSGLLVAAVLLSLITTSTSLGILAGVSIDVGIVCTARVGYSAYHFFSRIEPEPEWNDFEEVPVIAIHD